MEKVSPGFPWGEAVEAHGMCHGRVYPMVSCPGCTIGRATGCPLEHTSSMAYSIGCNHGDSWGTPWNHLLWGTCYGVRHGSIRRMMIVIWDTPLHAPSDTPYNGSTMGYTMEHTMENFMGSHYGSPWDARWKPLCRAYGTRHGTPRINNTHNSVGYTMGTP